MPQEKPLLTIGLPVFNSEKTVANALKSLANQTMGDFTVLISDNCSTDYTSEIAQNHASSDTRFKYFRQITNIGARENFHYVLRQADTKFFMWAAADDYWGSRFAEKNVEALQSNENLVASVSRIQMDGFPSLPYKMQGTFPLMGSFSQRLSAYLSEPGTNSRFYGIFRTLPLQNSFKNFPLYAFDWSVIIETLTYGEFNEVEDVQLFRGGKGLSNQSLSSQTKKCNSGFLNRLFPLLPFSRALLKNYSQNLTAGNIWQLASLNFLFSKTLCRELFRKLLLSSLRTLNLSKPYKVKK